MSELIEVMNSTAINAIYFGLIASGYSYADIQKPDEILKLIKPIRNNHLPKTINDFFSEARQYTCTAYPYWPRAALMETATFFVKDIYNPDTFDYFKYYNEVMKYTNLIESERDGHFWSWIKEFPYMLKGILLDKRFQKIDEYIKKWISEESKSYENKIAKIEQSLIKLVVSEGKEVQPIKVIISPLKCVYSADYKVSYEKLFVVIGDFLPHSIVHECIHPIVHPHIIDLRSDILQCIGSKIYNIDKSYYLNKDEDGLINAFEENIVRRVTELVVDGDYNISIRSLLMDEICNA
jgi:hypothetical protein